jgi:hypothetical protein
MDAQSLKQYLADSPPTVVPLLIKPHFEALTDKEKLYAHWISVYEPLPTAQTLSDISSTSRTMSSCLHPLQSLLRRHAYRPPPMLPRIRTPLRPHSRPV